MLSSSNAAQICRHSSVVNYQQIKHEDRSPAVLL